MSNLTMTDLFCGAGGSSTGAVSVPGVSVRLAANHWATAIETHNANHPDTDHLQADISNTDPRYIPGTDILWASPECTNHSRAKGRKAPSQPDLFGEVLPDEAAERSRATMWDVVRFTEAHEYRAILVENVVEVVDWTSVNGRKGGLFDSWLSAMHAMGYRHRIISLNSMHAQAYGRPAPQSRDRVYIAFWREGERAPDFERMQRPRAYCPACGEVVDSVQSWKKPGTRTGRYRSQYVYRCPKHSCRGQIVEPGWLPAASIIDWSIPGQRIGDRDRPLAEKTMRRIQLGIERYWSPIHLEAAGNTYEREGYVRAWPTDEPFKTIHTTMSKALAYDPVMVPVEGRDGKEPRSGADPMRTMTTRNETGVAMAPFLTQFRDRVRDLDPRFEPLRTVVADGANYGMVAPPFIAELRGGGSTARPTDDPLATVTASGNHHALITSYYGNGGSVPTDRALPTVTSRDHHGLVVPAGGTWNDDARPTDEAKRSVTTREAYGVATGQTVNIDDVRFRMLEPHEIKQAMAFPADYVMVGTRREQVKQSGNAVTPPAARDLIGTVVEAFTGEAVAA